MSSGIGGIFPYEVGMDGHVDFPSEQQLREHPITVAGGDADVLFFRQQVYNQARGMEFIHAYMTMMIDHRAHDVNEVTCLEEGIHALLGQMFEGHPLVAEVEEDHVKTARQVTGEETDQVLDANLLYDEQMAVQQTLMMQTMMGMADLLIEAFDYVANRETFLTHQAMVMSDSDGFLGRLFGSISLPDDRMNMLHQPRMGWIHRIMNDYVAKCAEIAPDAWVKSNRHMWSNGLKEEEMCPVVRQFAPGIKLHEDGRVVLDEPEKEG